MILLLLLKKYISKKDPSFLGQNGRKGEGEREREREREREERKEGWERKGKKTYVY